MHRDLAEAVLRSPRTRAALLEVLRELPDDVDAELATLRVLEVLSPSTLFVDVAGRLPLPVIARLLSHAPRAVHLDAQAIFIAEAARVAGGEDLRPAWLRALAALSALGAYEGLDPKRRRARARVLMADPVFRAAVHAAVASDATNQERALIELLAVDGSEESADALLVEVGRAERSPLRLRQLVSVLRLGARVPRLELLLRALEARLAGE